MLKCDHWVNGILLITEIMEAKTFQNHFTNLQLQKFIMSKIILDLGYYRPTRIEHVPPGNILKNNPYKRIGLA